MAAWSSARSAPTRAASSPCTAAWVLSSERQGATSPAHVSVTPSSAASTTTNRNPALRSTGMWPYRPLTARVASIASLSLPEELERDLGDAAGGEPPRADLFLHAVAHHGIVPRRVRA